MSRKPKGKKLKRKTIIFCEGETEKYYFDMLKKKYGSYSVNVWPVQAKVVKGQSLTLVKNAIKQINSKTNKTVFEKKYVVYDKDDEDKQSILEAISLANKNDIITLYSNECFEYWILLHFKNKNGHLSRKKLYEELEKELDIPDYKSLKGEEISRFLVDKIKTAHENALSLKLIKDPFKSVDSNPYTNIHHYIKDIFGVTMF